MPCRIYYNPDPTVDLLEWPAKDKINALLDELARLYAESLVEHAEDLADTEMARGADPAEEHLPTALDLFEMYCDDGDMPWDGEITARVAKLLNPDTEDSNDQDQEETQPEADQVQEAEGPAGP